MYSIEKLTTEQLKELGRVFSEAYPGIARTPDQYEKRLAIQNQYEFINFYGVFDNQELLGGMRIHDFKMNLLQQRITAGGIGSVAVGLEHKKKKVAYQMLKFFLQQCRDKGASLALLYPFNPAFYKKMGFGFGTSMNHFRIKPDLLPKGPSKANIRRLTLEDAPELCTFYNRMVRKTNGLIEKCYQEFSGLLSEPTNIGFAYYEDGIIQGYIMTHFKTDDCDSFLVNDLVVSELLFDSPAGFLELMTFLHSQRDQFRHVVINTQDEDFHFSLDDPRNNSQRLLTSVYHEYNWQGTGVMYRVVDVARLLADLADHNFNGQTLRLKLSLTDTFVAENSRSYLLYFDNGKLDSLQEGPYDVELRLDIADFSSLITCSVTLKSLYKWGRASMSDQAYLSSLNTLFASDDKPKCLTYF